MSRPSAVIWGACGSLPCPATPSVTRSKVMAALWAARDVHFESIQDVENYLGSFPLSAVGSYKGNTSCVQIDVDQDEVFLCDMGSGLRDFAISRGKAQQPTTYHIFISHLHWDHIQGLPFFGPAYHPDNRIVIHSAHAEIEAVLKAQMQPPVFPVAFENFKATFEFDVRKGAAEFDIGGLHVQSIEQRHPGISWGYRFEHSGKTIVYSTDSEHGTNASRSDYPFVEFFRDADIVIFDGQYSYSEATNEKVNWGHSNHITGVELAARARARNLVIFHHEPAYTDTDLESFLEKSLLYRGLYNRGLHAHTTPATLYPERITLAYDGLRIEA